MISSTLKHYKYNYKNRLQKYLKDYEDNTESLFLKNDLNDYTNYYNSLKKVFHFTKTSPSNNLGHYPITSEVGWELEIINKPVFNEIISEKKADPEYDEDEYRRLLYPGKNAPSIEINIKVLNNLITSATRILVFIKEKQESIVPEGAQKEEAYKEEVWFKIGILLASGKMNKYYTINSKGKSNINSSYSAPIIAEELGDKKYHKDILATLNDYPEDNSNANKNIYNSRDKMLKIKSHLEEQGIALIPYFTERIPAE